MGGQITTIPQGAHKQILYHENKSLQEGDNALRGEQHCQKLEYEFRPSSDILRLLKQYRQDQLKYECSTRNDIIQSIINKYDDQYERDNNLIEYSISTLFQKYQEQFVLPFIKQHEQFCFTCTGRHWQLRQWNISESEAFIEEGQNYQIIKFDIKNPDELTDYLQVILYKYLQSGNGYLKSDNVRNMKIFKKPLSELQLTDLMLNHQYLVVECQNSYWSFQKDTKKLIIQASILLSDVRDRILGEKRIKKMSFTWFGLREKWFPEVMYESNDLIVRNISDVRVFAQHYNQTSFKYNVFKANCKIYAQYIMKSSITNESWEKNKTFFDFFNT